jgi:hypothetical protein
VRLHLIPSVPCFHPVPPIVLRPRVCSHAHGRATEQACIAADESSPVAVASTNDLSMLADLQEDGLAVAGGGRGGQTRCGAAWGRRRRSRTLPRRRRGPARGARSCWLAARHLLQKCECSFRPALAGSSVSQVQNSKLTDSYHPGCWFRRAKL